MDMSRCELQSSGQYQKEGSRIGFGTYRNNHVDITGQQ